MSEIDDATQKLQEKEEQFNQILAEFEEYNTQIMYLAIYSQWIRFKKQSQTREELLEQQNAALQKEITELTQSLQDKTQELTETQAQLQEAEDKLINASPETVDTQ